MSNFICDKCGMTNIDCGRQGYKTPREIELEKQNTRLQAELDKAIHQLKDYEKALREYANSDYWCVSCEFDGDCVFLYKLDSNGYKLAQETLKKWEAE